MYKRCINENYFEFYSIVSKGTNWKSLANRDANKSRSIPHISQTEGHQYKIHQPTRVRKTQQKRKAFQFPPYHKTSSWLILGIQLNRNSEEKAWARVRQAAAVE
ncbi:hypothetical protein CEXT_386801 [Caerostris extrusa]|uniref:Uncharacterized protein n=1 Tax=Caerostris extrusa TaxID=172846 RepID=A0AAV4NM31_CAEEX|nr:hypothetical protein CEXT_386801 [Caerostris extrusa]